MNCGNCKHWGNESDVNEEFRECQGLKHDYMNYTDKDNKDFAIKDEDNEKLNTINLFRSENKAVTLDGSGYKAVLKCREDFGCVLFEINEQVNNATDNSR